MNLALPNGIQLTEIRRSDQDVLIEFLNDRDVNATTVRIPFPYTAADADWFTTVEELTNQHGQPLNWAIRNEADKLIGDIGFERGSGDQLRHAEIGYWLAKPFWGRGIMTAVVKAICQHAFESLELARIGSGLRMNSAAVIA
jgi:RimJ/RimL family protein N-acetyltransferase